MTDKHEHRPVNAITADLLTHDDIWRAINRTNKNVDRLTQHLLPDTSLGSKGRLAEIEEKIDHNTTFRERTTKRFHMVMGGIIVLQFVFGLLIIYLQTQPWNQ